MSDVTAEDRTVLKLIFWILSGLFVIMTTIGGATANRMLGQSDSMIKSLSDIQVDQAAQKVFIQDLERRMSTLEQLYYRKQSR